VIVVVQDFKPKEFKKYRSKYLVVCDGNQGSTRSKEGIKFDGVGTPRNSLSIQVAGNLSPYPGTRPVYGVIYISNPKVNGGFCLEDQVRQYVQSLAGLPDDAGLEMNSRL
jgi:hypothetical protein